MRLRKIKFSLRVSGAKHHAKNWDNFPKFLILKVSSIFGRHNILQQYYLAFCLDNLISIEVLLQTALKGQSSYALWDVIQNRESVVHFIDNLFSFFSLFSLGHYNKKNDWHLFWPIIELIKENWIKKISENFSRIFSASTISSKLGTPICICFKSIYAFELLVCIRVNRHLENTKWTQI